MRKNRKAIVKLVCFVTFAFFVLLLCRDYLSPDKELNTDNLFPATWTDMSQDGQSVDVAISDVVSVTGDTAFVVLQYEEKVEPQNFFVINSYIDLSESAFLETAESIVKLFIDESIDYNGSVVTSDIFAQDENIKKGDCLLQRVVKSDSEGNLNFSIAVGNEKNTMTGTVNVNSVCIESIKKCSEYTLLESEDKSIRIVLNKSDLDESNITSDLMNEWINLYAQFRRDIKWLVGDKEPYYGTSDFIMTETFPYYALSGDPIYINSEFVMEDLANIKLNPESANVLWAYVHEMSHSFDGINSENIHGYWNFDPEFFATLKTVYALSNHGYGMDENDSGESILHYFSKSDTLKNGGYSSDGLIYTLLPILYECSEEPWNHLRNVFLEINECEFPPTRCEEKFALFWSCLNQEFGMKVENFLSDEAWNAITDKYGFYEETQ